MSPPCAHEYISYMEIYNSFKSHSFISPPTQQQINISIRSRTRAFIFLCTTRVYVNGHVLTFHIYIHFLCFFICHSLSHASTTCSLSLSLFLSDTYHTRTHAYTHAHIHTSARRTHAHKHTQIKQYSLALM